MPKLWFVTLGCAKNEVDTDHMIRRALEAGYALALCVEEADAVIVNTCSFIQAATEESLETIFDLADNKHISSKRVPIIAAGCLPSRYGEDLSQELTEVKTFVPCNKENDLVAVLNEIFGDNLQRCEQNPSDTQKPSVSAYVKISDGCDRFCSYCTIPFIRGSYKSFKLDEIVDEVAFLVNQGVREIVLIAQDTGRWGKDLKEPCNLSFLLESLADRFSDTWFRVMYLQPEGITDELLDVVNRFDNICSYFDIPLQHCNADILRAMNRTGSSSSFLDMLNKIRKEVPGCTLRTTLIAGFPGETEKQFEELCDFVEAASFDYVGVFAYSREDGTKAATFEGQLPDDIKLERAQIIRDIADTLGTKKVTSLVGETLCVLIEGQEEDGQLFGRTQGQAPEVDGVVYVQEGAVGDKRLVKIEDSFLYNMEAV